MAKIQGGFVIIPKETLKHKRYIATKQYTKAVYTAILTEFIRDSKKNPLNKVTITHDQIQKISGCPHSSVVKGVRELKDKGFMRTLTAGGLEKNPSTFQLNGRYTHSGSKEVIWYTNG